MSQNVVRYPNNFKALIKRQGYNISEVARELGIPPRTMSNYLGGVSAMPGDLRKQLAEIISCDFAELRIYEPHASIEDEMHVELPGGADDMDRLRRTLLETVGLAGATFVLSPQTHIVQDKKGDSHSPLNEDYVNFLENEMAARWDLYHVGGANRAGTGLDTWINAITRLPHLTRETQLHNRTLTLLTMSYQLQSCVLRDKMQFALAHAAHQNAYHAARELGDPELIAAALAREGLTYLQQDKPKDAIIYLSGASEIISKDQLPALSGYIQQALSEAYAKAQQYQESWSSIAHAEDILTLLSGNMQERNQKNQSRLNMSSVTAQRGVNESLLNNHKQAIEHIDTSLKTYNPALIRGRARLIAQKAESYYGLQLIDACATSAQEAFQLASAVGSDKTAAKIRNLSVQLSNSPWKGDKEIIALSNMVS